MTASEKVDAYIEKHAHWKDELTTLRRVFNSTELEEEVKWGAPSYAANKKLVAGLGAFKHHCAIWFHQGVFLKDLSGKLKNAQEGKTKAMRQWRFEKGDEIPESLVVNYIQEAIENCLAGKEIKPVRNTAKNVAIPPLLKIAFDTNKELQTAFNKFTPGKQREYCEFIGSAKQEATKLRRLEKSIPMIINGIGLNDKYKNC